MATGTHDTAGGEVATFTVFRSFLEVSGDPIGPSTLTKATLTDLNHTLEDLVLVDDAPGTVLTGFQESQHRHAERLRHEALAVGKQRSVAAFCQGELGRATTVRRFKLDRGHALPQEWSLFASVWTFDPAVIGDLLGAWQTVRKDTASPT